MTDVALSERFGVPTRTLADWKKQKPTNWRRKMYLFMQETLIKEQEAERKSEALAEDEKEVSRS